MLRAQSHPLLSVETAVARSRNFRRQIIGAVPFPFGTRPSDRSGLQQEVSFGTSAARRTMLLWFLNFRDPVAANLSTDPAGYRRALRHVRESLLKVSPGGFVPTRQFEHVPAMAGRISRAALEALSRDPNVSFIQIDGLGHGALSVSVPAIGADVAKTEYHVTGKGVRVAVLDTGANSTHPEAWCLG